MPIAKNPKHGSLTPMFLYAHKLYNDVKYMEWDVDDAQIKHALGKGREWYVDCRRGDTERPEIEDREALRAESRLGTAEETVPVESYAFTKVGTGSPVMWRVILQRWIAAPSKREPGVMILDPWDWDAVPDSLDIMVEEAINETELFPNLLPYDGIATTKNKKKSIKEQADNFPF